MANPSSFEERLHQMERTRNERHRLLQAENTLQTQKSLVLASNLVSLRDSKRRCLLLEKTLAEIGARIISDKAEIEMVEGKRRQAEEEQRVWKGEIWEMEEKRKEKEGFYEEEGVEMEGFREKVRGCVEKARLEVEELCQSVSQLQATLRELQGKDGCLNNSEIIEAERKKMELLGVRDNLDNMLATNGRLKSLLEKQLQRVLGNQDGRKGL